MKRLHCHVHHITCANFLLTQPCWDQFRMSHSLRAKKSGTNSRGISIQLGDFIIA